MFRDVPNDGELSPAGMCRVDVEVVRVPSTSLLNFHPDGDLWLIRMNTSSWVAASPNPPVGGHEKPPVHKIVSDLKRDHVGAE